MKNTFGMLALAAGLALPTVAMATVTWPGPDAFGYSGTTSNGNQYSTIKGNGGVRLTPADPAAANYDDRFYLATIPFNFNLYGTTNTQAYVSTNGFMSFGGTTNANNNLDTQVATSYLNGNFNSATFPQSGTGAIATDRQIIAPWWDDMQFTSGQQGGIYTLLRTVSGVQEFVVEWANVAFFNSTTDGVSFQAILREDGTMTFNYGDSTSSAAGNTLGASGTIGIHNLGGNSGNNGYLQYSFNQAAAISNGFRINIVPAPSALALLGLGGLVTTRRRR